MPKKPKTVKIVIQQFEMTMLKFEEKTQKHFDTYFNDLTS